jgi:hypothetical protein
MSTKQRKLFPRNPWCERHGEQAADTTAATARNTSATVANAATTAATAPRPPAQGAQGGALSPAKPAKVRALAAWTSSAKAGGVRGKGRQTAAAKEEESGSDAGAGEEASLA